MKRVVMFVFALAVVMMTGQGATADSTAVNLMEESHATYYYAKDGGQSRVTMVMTDKKGRERERVFWMLRADVADMGDQRYYAYFIKPGDVSRTAFLVHKKAEGNDDRWLYIPSLDLVRRIAADDRRASFMGSDFTYEDVSGRLPVLDNHEIVGQDSVMGRAATKVKSTPKDEGTADYAYRYTWIGNETKLPLREEYYNAKDELVRTFEVGEIKVIEGVPTAVERTMTEVKDNQFTTITFEDISYESSLKPDDFNERLLKNPPREYAR